MTATTETLAGEIRGRWTLTTTAGSPTRGVLTLGNQTRADNRPLETKVDRVTMDHLVDMVANQQVDMVANQDQPVVMGANQIMEISLAMAANHNQATAVKHSLAMAVNHSLAMEISLSLVMGVSLAMEVSHSQVMVTSQVMDRQVVSLSLIGGSDRNKRRVGGTTVGVAVAMVTKVTLVVASMEADTDHTGGSDFI